MPLIKVKSKEVEELLEKENLKWKVRAKKHWLQHGDRNTRYFHTCASQRRRKNTIVQIRDEEGRSVGGEEQIEQVFSEYFRGIYTSSNPSLEQVEHCLNGLEQKIDGEKRRKMERSFTTEEVERALKQMSVL